MERGEKAHREGLLRKAVLRGDESAWQSLYDGSFRVLYRFVFLHMNRDPAATEEVIQESWMVAVRRIRSFDPERSAFETWLVGIAHHVMRNARRRRAGPTALPAEPPMSHNPGPLEQHSLADQLAGTMTAIPDHYREVLLARYQEGRSVAEIAAGSCQSLKATESLLSRARQAFKEAYRRLHGEQSP